MTEMTDAYAAVAQSRLTGRTVTINGDRERRPSIHQRAEILNTALDAIEAAVGALDEKLSEVLLDEDTVVSKPAFIDAPGEPDGSWLARYLEETRARILRLTNHVAALVERVDL